MTISLSSSLETRMKGYEKAAAQQFAPRNTIIVRVDGVAFHTYTKGANKPFDTEIAEAMQVATEMVQRSVQGCVIGYTQSDEASFLLTDLQSPGTQGWYGFKKSKLESVIASMFTYYFNDHITSPRLMHKPNGDHSPALFDARSFSVPSEDAPNVFVWRQGDAYKNFINLLARSFFGHSVIQGKSLKDMVDMLSVELGMKPEEAYLAHFSVGTVYSDVHWPTSAFLGYHGFRQIIEGKE